MVPDDGQWWSKWWSKKAISQEATVTSCGLSADVPPGARPEQDGPSRHWGDVRPGPRPHHQGETIIFLNLRAIPADGPAPKQGKTPSRLPTDANMLKHP